MLWTVQGWFRPSTYHFWQIWFRVYCFIIYLEFLSFQRENYKTGCKWFCPLVGLISLPLLTLWYVLWPCFSHNSVGIIYHWKWHKKVTPMLKLIDVTFIIHGFHIKLLISFENFHKIIIVILPRNPLKPTLIWPPI